MYHGDRRERSRMALASLPTLRASWGSNWERIVFQVSRVVLKMAKIIFAKYSQASWGTLLPAVQIMRNGS